MVFTKAKSGLMAEATVGQKFTFEPIDKKRAPLRVWTRVQVGPGKKGSED